MNIDLIQEALSVINLFELRRAKNEEINKHIRKVYPDFPPLVQHIDSLTEASFVKLLDLILSESGCDDLASYYLYECQKSDGTNTRKIIEHDVEYPLTNIMELAAYIYRERATC